MERASTAYQAEQGQDYFRYQDSRGDLRGVLLGRRFGPHVRPDDAVVDFGSGAGYLLAALLAREKVGVEVNEAAASTARARGITTVQSLDELEDERFDVAVSNHALEHVLQPYAELENLRRVLRPGGKLVLNLPAGDWRHEKRPMTNDPNHHLYAWTPQLIANLVGEAGFTVDEASIIRVVWPGPLAGPLSRWPLAFDAVGLVYGFVRRRRGLWAVAHKP